MLRYEPLALHHAEGLFAALAPAATHRFLPAPDVTTLAALRARIERLARGPAAWLNHVVIADDVIVGRLEATRHDGWAELAYLIGPAYQGRGYGRAAVRWLVEQLATECWVAIRADHARSIHLVRALGFVPQPTPPARPLESYDDGDVVLCLTTLGHVR